MKHLALALIVTLAAAAAALFWPVGSEPARRAASPQSTQRAQLRPVPHPTRRSADGSPRAVSPRRAVDRAVDFLDAFPQPDAVRARLEALATQQAALARPRAPDEDGRARLARRQAFRQDLREALLEMDPHDRAAMRRQKLTIVHLARAAARQGG